MSYRNYVTGREQAGTVSSAAVGSILRNVYLWMTGGLALTAVVSLLVARSDTLLSALVSNRVLFILLFIAEIGLVIYLSARIRVMKPGAAVLGFITYAVLNGITLSLVLLAYTGVTIAAAFFVTAGTFAGMSIYGSLTKRDLSKIGSFLMMGLIGIIIASVVNLFLRSSALYYGVSYIGVFIFLGLTAWDTQVIKRWSSSASGGISEGDYVKLSILGALKLYLDFINLFLFFLRIFGRRS